MQRWVLVVARDERRQQLMRRQLEDAGYVVEIASCVDAAIVCLAVMKPSLLVVDEQLADRERLQDAMDLHTLGSLTEIPVITVAGALAPS